MNELFKFTMGSGIIDFILGNIEYFVFCIITTLFILVILNTIQRIIEECIITYFKNKK
jgi:hypothetical protein